MGITINEGDIVSVDFNGAQITLCHRAQVVRKPQATGDSWVFLNLETKDLYYVSEGCTITKKSNKES